MLCEKIVIFVPYEVSKKYSKKNDTITIMKAKTLILSAVAVLAASCTTNTATWSPAGDNIKTRWASEITPENVHKEYPRPQMVREQWQSLNGLWDYAISPAAQEEMPEAEGQILVPFCIESSLSGVGRSITGEDALWYNRTFKIPRHWRSSHIILHFEAVDWAAQVWVNGKPACSHTGGYTSFGVDITPYLEKGRTQTVTVKVLDGTDNALQPRGKQVSNPHSIWYTAVSGIWQSVWMEPVSASHIAGFTAVPDIDAKQVKFAVETTGAQPGDQIKVSVTGNDRTCEATFEAGAEGTVELGEELRLWSPDDPYLYDLNVSLCRDGKVIDIVKGYTAMRKIATYTDADGHKRMALNGEPLFHYGPLDQGWWPDGLYTAPSDEAMRYDLIKTKDLGFNMIRKHIKIEPATWYRACDELGLLVWQDMPSMDDNRSLHWLRDMYIDDAPVDCEWPHTEAQRNTYYKEWGEIIAQRKAFPCIVVWVPFNEAWAQFNTREAVEFTRAQDPTRLINPASGGNFVRNHGGDILDYHHYPHPHMGIWESESVNALGEYGGIGLPLEGHVWNIDRKWGYVQYPDIKSVTDEYVNFASMLEPLVKEGLSAAVYTQTTDVEGEVNGLMTYDREVVKVEEARVRAANEAVIAAMK